MVIGHIEKNQAGHITYVKYVSGKTIPFNSKTWTMSVVQIEFHLDRDKETLGTLGRAKEK